jgi:hypothetical protein
MNDPLVSTPRRGASRGTVVLTTCALLALLGASSAISACHRKITSQQCNELVDRFAELVVKERMPDAGPEVIATEQARERSEAAHDDSFKNCASQVTATEHSCALKATTSEGLIKCLE